MAHPLHIYYQNTQGLRTKTQTFYENLLSSNYDVICLSETWLSGNIFSSELFGDGYMVYRRDRESSSSTKSEGGGVLVAVKTSFRTTRCTDLETEAEDVWISIDSNGDGRFLLCCAYIPPGSDSSLCAFVDGLCKNENKIQEGAVLMEKYCIEAILGEGGFGRVFSAREPGQEGQRRAIKEVHLDPLAAREAEFMGLFDHCNILPLIETLVEPPHLYLVLPLCEEDLGTFLAREGPRRGPSSFFRVVRQIAVGLAECHRHGVVHRDLKPGNVLRRGARFMLADFGVAEQITPCRPLLTELAGARNNTAGNRTTPRWIYGP
ncbi:cyclin-dependent kinase 9-like [Coccinella septempunctata]|uniref:cyclin-dependent kinase 9-like n=1 Tax=Coccinella septempunctata TaxID=41139 RepID=UPI001D07323C|nr:cyclin-dependent kinase 9-like [Coccinella septempunctata]